MLPGSTDSSRLPSSLQFAAASPGNAVFMSTPGGYPPSSPGYSPPPPGYTPPPIGQPAGLSQNAASALCYVLGFITGIIFLVLEPYKRDRIVRFHAFQSIFLNVLWIVFWIAWGVVSGILAVLTHGLFAFIALLINAVLGLGFLVLWIILIIKAAQGQKWSLPIVGPLAEKQAAGGSF